MRINKGSSQLRKDENGLYILDNPFKNQVGKVIPDPARLHEGRQTYTRKVCTDQPDMVPVPERIINEEE